MIAENINDVKKFMSTLLIGNSFDDFYVTDITITTYNTFHIDGHIRSEFYSSEEYEELNSPILSKWSTLKPFCYEIIKGKKTPLNFKIIFSMPHSLIEKLITENAIPISADNVANLFLNIKYDEGLLSFVTGTSLKIFLLDKALENAFDKYILNFISTLF